VRREVVVRKFPDGYRSFEAVCFGDLAVGRRLASTDYTIYHLPSGFAMAGAGAVFRYEHTAVAAMMALARIKNRWVFDDLAEMQRLKTAIRTVCALHGGTEAAPHTLREVQGFQQDLNGYDGS
jgi:hypothetical protein